MTARQKERHLTPATVVVAAVGGAFLGNWIVGGWISAVIGALGAVTLVAYGLSGDN